jgi:VanZ family protein
MPLWNRLKQWLPAVLWAIVISWASTDTFSSSNTSSVFIPILHWLLPNVGPEALERVHFFIRKSAHFTEYFVFSVILLRSVRGNEKGWRLHWAIWALVIAAGYSALDELHQSFVPSRTASAWDSLLDTTGAAAAQVLAGFWSWIRRKQPQ